MFHPHAFPRRAMLAAWTLSALAAAPCAAQYSRYSATPYAPPAGYSAAAYSSTYAPRLTRPQAPPNYRQAFYQDDEAGGVEEPALPMPTGPAESPSDMTGPPPMPEPAQAPLEPTPAPAGGGQLFSAPGAGGGYAPMGSSVSGGNGYQGVTNGLWDGYVPSGICSGGNCGIGKGASCEANECLSGFCATGPGYGPRCRHWFGGIYGLVMDRDDENEVWLSFDSTAIGSRLLGSRDASVDWQAGNELRFGSTFACFPYAWEVVYWGLYEENETAIVSAATVGNPISTSLDFSGLDYDDGGGIQGVNSYYDGVDGHRLRRHYELQNVELNFIRFPLAGCAGPCGVVSSVGCGDACDQCGASGGCGCNPGLHKFGGIYGVDSRCGRRFSVVGTAGVRYLRIDEGFQFASSPTDLTFGDDDDDIFYDIEVENRLFGLQLGAAANYQATQCFSLYLDGKFGIFGNEINHTSQIYGNQGFATVAAGLPFAGQDYNVNSSKDDVSFLGEFRVGGGVWVRPRCRLFGGWRALAITGVGLPTNMIPQNFADLNDVATIDSNGSVIIHGLEAGVEFSF